MSYDAVSFFYDALARLVFADAQMKAQESTLHHIRPGSRVLIAGGGSGWLLEAIGKIHLSGLSITYIDSSAKMIAHARRRDVAKNDVVFITSSIMDAQFEPGSFDVIITPFLFDNFTQSECDQAFTVLHHSLAAGGRWLFTDFRKTNKIWHGLLLRSMYLFFRVLAGIHARQLPDTDGLFSMADYYVLADNKFSHGFIGALAYGKP